MLYNKAQESFYRERVERDSVEEGAPWFCCFVAIPLVRVAGGGYIYEEHRCGLSVACVRCHAP